MTHSEKRIYLIQELLSEQPQYRDMEIPNSVEEQKRLLRSLMNIRSPRPIGAEFLKVQDDEYDDGLFDRPDFETIEITPITIGKIHATIEAATAMIDEKQFTDADAKKILSKLCKEYPVVCSAVMKLLNEG